MRTLQENPEDVTLMETISLFLENLSYLKIDLDLWRAQNICFHMKQLLLKEKNIKSQQGDSRCRAWLRAFVLLAEFLQVNLGNDEYAS
jgi:hypothetical protein